ncbi:hypothetical protein V2E29_04345 [Streptomyces diastatochromogenes]|uniref:hypothetical protein n=1 Tax=Streptomyces diastatochromogenes TaxID=42236 RepID=UPI002F26DAB7
MWLRKTKLLPGGAPGGYEWNSDQDVVEVPDDLGVELVAVPDAGFAEVAPPAAKNTKVDAPAKETPTDSTAEAPNAPKKRAARKPAATEISE